MKDGQYEDMDGAANRILIDVKDACGGLPPGRAASGCSGDRLR